MHPQASELSFRAKRGIWVWSGVPLLQVVCSVLDILRAQDDTNRSPGAFNLASILRVSRCCQFLPLALYACPLLFNS